VIELRKAVETVIQADAGDAILRAAIREQVGSTVKRLHRNGAIENIGAGRNSKWELSDEDGIS
jgi:hypothetical protein